MKDIIIYAILLLIVGMAVWGTVKRVRHGSACCGEHDSAPAKVRVKDRNKKNYPYLYDLGVDGMHCANCARRIENVFNGQEGFWAEADVGENRVRLRSKREVGRDELRKTVSDAGYTLLSMEQIKT